MDNCYCLIRIVFSNTISLYFFKNQNCKYPICFTSQSAYNLSKLIFLYNRIRNLSCNHCLYLGQELYKAELCLVFNQEYIQN